MPDPIFITPHILLIENFCQKLIDAVLKSLSVLPETIRKVLMIVKEEAEKKDQSWIRICLSSVFFLRYLSSALVNPEKENIASSKRKIILGNFFTSSNSFFFLGIGINPTERKILVLVAKVIQLIANGQLFPEQEEKLTLLNPFLQRNFQLVDEFCEHFSKTEKRKNSLSDVNKQKVLEGRPKSLR